MALRVSRFPYHPTGDLIRIEFMLRLTRLELPRRRIEENNGPNRQCSLET